ncbi:IclR family transcriptional regulator [Planktotalea arctica]|uniref:IclR family transcriptional regulator n=1 Tax=Planktotalea arctica TaxID=1481893 RepID=UPI00321932DF
MTKLNRSIERGISVLEAVHTCGRIPLGALATRTGLPKPTVLRICKTLEQRRWLFRQSSDGCYQLGSAFPQEAGMPNRVDKLVAVGKGEILKLSNDTGLASDLAAGISDGRVEIVDTSRVYKVHAIYPDAVGFRPSPILSALGSAYLFAMAGAQRVKALQELVGQLSREETKALPQLEKILSDIGARGYAIRSPGHWGRAVDYGALPAAIAVPIIAGGEPVGSVNLVWNANNRCLETVVKDHLAQLQATAQTIGKTYTDQS